MNILDEFKSDDPKYLGKPIWLKDAEVGKEYWICDCVVGRVDESLVEVIEVSDNKAFVYDLHRDKEYLLYRADIIVAHQNAYDEVYYCGIDWLNSL